VAQSDPFLDHSFAWLPDQSPPEAVPPQYEALGAGLPTHRGQRSQSRESRLSVILCPRVAGWEAPPGVEIISRLGNFFTARVSQQGLEAIKADPDVTAEASRPGGVSDCQRSMPWVKASGVHAAPQLNERGGECLVGVIDTGIDVFHDAFRDAQGRTRIAAIWDQRSQAPNSLAPSQRNSTFAANYGSLHLRTDIDRYLSNNQLEAGLTRDPDGHGTHVASIAAGSPIPGAKFPGGVAPEAEIIVVISALNTAPGDPRSLGYSVSHVDALAFLRTFAELQKSPIAVNVSQGMNAGAHDGTSLLENAFDAFSGGGRDPGFVIVKSAGNEFGHAGHARTRVFNGGVSELAWSTQPGAGAIHYIEVWFGAADDIEFRLDHLDSTTSDTLRSSDWVTRAAPGNQVRFRDHGASLTLERHHHDNGDHRLVISLWPQATTRLNQWRLLARGQQVRSEGLVDAWVERDPHRMVSFRTGDVNGMTLSIPGSARTTITVGACESADPLRLGSFSSHGPTRDGRKKPDVCAPGVAIEAARAGSRDQLVAQSGTSMAAPHVTGAIALLLSRQKRLRRTRSNAAQIAAALRQSARNFNGRWHEGFGYGGLDVEALINTFE